MGKTFIHTGSKIAATVDGDNVLLESDRDGKIFSSQVPIAPPQEKKRKKQKKQQPKTPLM